MSEEKKEVINHNQEFWDNYDNPEEEFEIRPGYFHDWNPITPRFPDFGPAKIEPMTLTKTYRPKCESERIFREDYN